MSKSDTRQNATALIVDGPRPAVSFVAAIPRSYRLSPGDRLILTMLACDSFDGELSAPTTGALAQWVGMFPSSVYAALDRLSETTERRPALVAREETTRGRNRTVWRLLLQPSDSPGGFESANRPANRPTNPPANPPGLSNNPLPFPSLLKPDPSGLGGTKPDKSGDLDEIGSAVSSPDLSAPPEIVGSAPKDQTGDLTASSRGPGPRSRARATRAQIIYVRDLRTMTGEGLDAQDPLTGVEADEEIRYLTSEIERRRHNGEPLDGNYWDLSQRARDYVDKHDLDIDRREAS